MTWGGCVLRRRDQRRGCRRSWTKCSPEFQWDSIPELPYCHTHLFLPWDFFILSQLAGGCIGLGRLRNWGGYGTRELHQQRETYQKLISLDLPNHDQVETHMGSMIVCIPSDFLNGDSWGEKKDLKQWFPHQVLRQVVSRESLAQDNGKWKFWEPTSYIADEHCLRIIFSLVALTNPTKWSLST